MINSCKATKKINSFEYVAIPSPRQIFNRYGERENEHGLYLSDGTGSDPVPVSSGSVIDQMINAQRMLESDLSRQ